MRNYIVLQRLPAADWPTERQMHRPVTERPRHLEWHSEAKWWLRGLVPALDRLSTTTGCDTTPVNYRRTRTPFPASGLSIKGVAKGRREGHPFPIGIAPDLERSKEFDSSSTGPKRRPAPKKKTKQKTKEEKTEEPFSLGKRNAMSTRRRPNATFNWRLMNGRREVSRWLETGAAVEQQRNEREREKERERERGKSAAGEKVPQGGKSGRQLNAIAHAGVFDAEQKKNNKNMQKPKKKGTPSTGIKKMKMRRESSGEIPAGCRRRCGSSSPSRRRNKSNF